MWKGYEGYLCQYGKDICLEWRDRGYEDSQLYYFNEYYFDLIEPPWLGNSLLHSSHRTKLITKNSFWYSQFGWVEKPDPNVSYYWPVHARK